jgi:tRNA G18 (ribose-2'-O)-methylase SpoU
MNPCTLAIIAHDIRSAYNIGSIFRTADAAGVSRIFLTGHSPAPIDRFGRPVGTIAKTALGAQTSVPWESKVDVMECIAQLRADGYSIVALEQTPESIDYKHYTFTGSVALIVGNEKGGVPPEVIAQCDAAVMIPMRGSKESLNVSVAAGIAIAWILAL